MTDTRFAPRLTTCSSCGEDVVEESVPGKPGRSRRWTPYRDEFGRILPSDVFHACEPATVLRFGAHLREQQLALDAQAVARPPRPAPPPPPPPVNPIATEFGDETL